MLVFYSLAWKTVFPLLAAVARLDALLRAGWKRGLFPARWRMADRLQWGGRIRRGTWDAWSAGGGTSIWMHCASLGEAKGLWALAESLPDAASRLVLTANTATGLDFLTRKIDERGAGRERHAAKVLDVCAEIAPFDHPGAVGRFLERHRVRGLCLYEAEIWPHYINACSARGLPVMLVSARATLKAMRRYRVFRGTVAALLNRLQWIQTQGETDGARFRSLCSAPVETGFDFKAAHYFRAPVPEASDRNRFALLSLHAAELDRLLPELPPLAGRFALTVFPRHLRELPRFRKRLEPLGFRLHSRDPGARLLLVDSMGRVEALLPACHSAFVGGSLIPKGCHNVWEPLAAGLKIYFGPSHHNQEALAELLLQRGIAETLRDLGQVGTWRAPGPETRAACATLWIEQKRSLDRALEAFRERFLISMQSRDSK